MLVHKNQLSNFLAGGLCPACHSNRISHSFESFLGFAAKICIKCSDCGKVISEFFTSPSIDNNPRKPLHVNKKIVKSMMIPSTSGAPVMFIRSVGTTKPLH